MLATLYITLSVVAFLSLATGLLTGSTFTWLTTDLRGEASKAKPVQPGAYLTLLGISAALFAALSYTAVSGVTSYDTCETTNTTETQVTTNTTETNTSCSPHNWRSTPVATLYGALATITLLLLLLYAL